MIKFKYNSILKDFNKYDILKGVINSQRIGLSIR